VKPDPCAVGKLLIALDQTAKLAGVLITDPMRRLWPDHARKCGVCVHVYHGSESEVSSSDRPDQFNQPKP